MNSTSPYRRVQSRRRGPGREEGDAVATALTIQVILCVILILLAAIMKKADTEKYGIFKARYDILTTDPAEGEKLAALFSAGGWERLFAGAEEFLGALFGFRSAGDEPPAEYPPDEPRPALEIVTEPPPVAPDNSDSITAYRYDYLEPEGMAYLAPDVSNAAWESRPYNLGELPVPESCTLTPVVLNAALLPPVTGVITSPFAYREHPITGREDFHNGMDIAANEGEPVLAPLPGEVEEAGWSDIYGNYIVLRHEEGFETFYGHCSELLVGEGGVLRQGEPIARVGGTGLTTGAHLHFSVIVADRFTDPYWILRDCIRPVA